MENEPQKITTIDYHPDIYHPITQYSAVQECLKYTEKATDEVGHEYAAITFDLGVCSKAYPLLWNFQQLFNRHIICWARA